MDSRDSTRDLIEDFDKNHHFWSLITNLKLLKQQLHLQNSKCRVRDRGYIYYYEKKTESFWFALH